MTLDYGPLAFECSTVSSVKIWLDSSDVDEDNICDSPPVRSDFTCSGSLVSNIEEPISAWLKSYLFV